MDLDGIRPPKVPNKEQVTFTPTLKERRLATRTMEGESETDPNSVERAMSRNSIFFVHTINEDARLRHNANSNVASTTTPEDDLDILLAFEPSVSASSVMRGSDEHGRVSGLWSGSGGVIISGGSIVEAHESDAGSVSIGIKNRRSSVSSSLSIKGIDAAIQSARRVTPDQIGGYNEFVINNPEISGYFKPGEQDEDGNYWMYSVLTRRKLERLHHLYNYSPNSHEYIQEHALFHSNLDRYRASFNSVRARGIPFYCMTPDRRLIEVRSIRDNGILEIGEELTPEKSAVARAGLPMQHRKRLGLQLLDKDVFKNPIDREEAVRIVNSL